jgi:protein subunit release factor A
LDQLASGDQELASQVADEEAALAAQLRSRELDLLFTDPYANHNAVVTISVGQGGVEAQDWVEMLMRMYLKWAERHGFQVEIIDQSPGEEAGLKSVTFIVRGQRAYGLLRSEHGVHRLPAGSAHRHISIHRRRRPTCQQDRLGDPHHASAHGHRRHLSKRAVADEES